MEPNSQNLTHERIQEFHSPNLTQERTQEKQDLSSPIKYCLYARKSTESEERQVLSIDSQIKEMLDMAEREHLNIVTMKRESHSAKETGTRPVFNEIISEIQEHKFDGILTWAPDRISRNAGDLGKIVDLMDSGLLKEIRTYGQRFSNSPNEKFLLMILGSQANNSKTEPLLNMSIMAAPEPKIDIARINILEKKN